VYRLTVLDNISISQVFKLKQGYGNCFIKTDADNSNIRRDRHFSGGTYNRHQI